MRSIHLLIAGSLLASCTAAPPPAGVAAAPPGELQRMLAGKVPGRPISCLPSYQSNDMRVIDGRTLAFRNGVGGTVYVAHLSPGCEAITSGANALVSRQIGGSGMCQGDIQQVEDMMAHVNSGSCTIEQIVPFSTPGR